MTLPPTTVELPSEPFAKIPHTLILSLEAPLVRCYGMLHYLGWNRLPFDVADLCRLLGPDEKPVNPRSIYRWLDALAEHGWIAYDRKPGKKGLGERISLYTSPFGRPATSDSDVRGSQKPLTLRSEDRETSDSTIRGSAQPLTLRSEDRETSDRRVRGAPDLAQQDAAKNAPQIPDQIPESDPESPPSIPIPDGAPDGWMDGQRPVLSDPVSTPPGPITNLETVALLRALGVVAIAKVAHHPPALVTRVIDAMKRRPDTRDLPSRVVDILRKVPPIDPADVAALDRWLATLESEASNGAHSARRPAAARPPERPSQPAPRGAPRAPKPHELEERFRRREAASREGGGDAAG